jgi:hypothetical protein
MPIGDSVGANGVNNLADVNIIHGLLNNVDPLDGGPDPNLPLSGLAPNTIDAIKKFQWRQFHLSPNHRGLFNPAYRTLPRMSPGSGPGVSYGRVNPNDETEQKLMRPPQSLRWSPPPGTRGGTDPRDPPLLFTDMWNYINNRWNLFYTNRVHLATAQRSIWQSTSRTWRTQPDVRFQNQAFRDEFWLQFRPPLIIAIFWEETGFRNMQGIAASHMWGFGQADSRMISAHNRNFRNLITAVRGTGRQLPSAESGIIGPGNFEASIDLYIVHLLEHWWGHHGRWQSRGANQACLDTLRSLGARSMDQKVRQWRLCMTQLNALSLSHNLTGISDSDGVIIREALYEARPATSNPRVGMGMSPDLAFPFRP